MRNATATKRAVTNFSSRLGIAKSSQGQKKSGVTEGVGVYAWCLVWDSKKLHPRNHKTTHVTCEYWHDRKKKLRKTGNEGKKLETKSKKHGVKNVSGKSHWFIFP